MRNGGYGIELKFSSRAAFFFVIFVLYYVHYTLLSVLHCGTAFMLNNSKKKKIKHTKNVELLCKEINWLLSFALPLYLCDSIEIFASLTFVIKTRHSFTFTSRIKLCSNSNLLHRLICMTGFSIEMKVFPFLFSCILPL